MSGRGIGTHDSIETGVMMNRTKRTRWTCRVAMFGFLFVLTLYRGDCQAQSLEDQGFQQIQSEHMTLVTDLEMDSELRNWPVYLDQALEQWKRIFKPDPSKLLQLHATVYLVGNRAKWENAGLLSEVPFLEEGYQLGNKLYVVEQPSEFYRRMLFLHEATHWIMYEWLGGAGSPWLMEGMADYLSTHQFQNEKVLLGYFPRSAEEVPSWGRILQVQKSMEQNNAPKLSEVLAFSDMRQRRMDRYCWSWAAVYFFDHHPEYGEDFRSLYQGELDYSLAASKQLKDLLEADWKKLSIQWRCFLDDLDFGYNPQLMLQWGDQSLQSIPAGGTHRMEIRADRGWQSTGVVLEAGQSINVRSTGSVEIKQLADGQSWRTTPKGISVEYNRGFKLGAMIGVLAPLDVEQPSQIWSPVLVGAQSTLLATEKSCLLLRVNDSAAGVSDNTGAFSVEIVPAR